MNKALVIVNPSSGKEKAVEYKDNIVAILEKRYGEVEVKETEGAGDAKRFADSGAKDGVELIVVVGGDGTVNEAVNGIAPHDIRPKFAIIPMGTVNDLARVLQIPLDPEDAVDMLNEEHVETIDIGKANDTYFTNALAIGRVPESIHEVTAEEKSKLGTLAYIWAGAKKLIENEKIKVKVTTDGEEYEEELSAVVMSLTGQLGGFKDIFPDAKLTDGKISVLLVHELDLIETAKLLPNLLSKRVPEAKNMTHIQTERITVEAVDGNTYVSDVDGEEGPKLPITVNVLKAHLDVLVPGKE